MGTGLIAEATTRVLGRTGPARHLRAPLCALESLDLAESSVAVLASDAWDTRHYAAIRARCAETRSAWMPVRTEVDRVVVGPMERAGDVGCHECGERRRRHLRRRADGHDAVWQQHGAVLAARPAALLTDAVADLAAELVAEEVLEVRGGRAPARTHRALLMIDLVDLDISTHRFLADPLCPICGVLVDDTPEHAVVELRPRPKLAPDLHRVRAVSQETDRLMDLYVDSETGLFAEVNAAAHGGVVMASASFGVRDAASTQRGDERAPHAREVGYGRADDYRMSKTVAVLEALERYGGLAPGGRRTTVFASYDEVADRAVDPRGLGLHAPHDYRRADFPFRPFAADADYPWVWGFSFGRQEPILVPETCAYYRTGRDGRGRGRFAFDSSNGSALGGCLEEAILHGILEVAERDAFLLTWYARLAVPRIDLRSAGSAVRTLVASVEADTGYQVMAFDTTLEQGVPCVQVIAVDRSGDPARPRGLCGAGSALDPERAVMNAVGELGPLLSVFAGSFADQRERAQLMAADSTLVASMPDHSVLYGAAEAFARLDFLTSQPASRDLSAMTTGDFRDLDLSNDLRDLLARYLDSGLDVVVVDQTTAEHSAADLACVRVIIPGALPMTFGHHFRRLEGLTRLRTVPSLLGYRDHPLSVEDVNPHPHPFP